MRRQADGPHHPPQSLQSRASVLGRPIALFAVFLCLSLPVLAQTADGPAITGTAMVVDGDGLKIGPVEIRIHAGG